jgi:hypothetical protein
LTWLGPWKGADLACTFLALSAVAASTLVAYFGRLCNEDVDYGTKTEKLFMAAPGVASLKTKN